jgi:hypothetical protein
VTASNNAFTSNSSEVSYLTFEDSGDVDDLVNVSMSRPTPTRVSLEWHKIRGVEGYRVQLRLPPNYAKRDAIDTTDCNVTRQYTFTINF